MSRGARTDGVALRTGLVGLVGLVGMVLLASGCERGPGDDGVPRPRATVTVTRTPSPPPADPVPDSIPPGTGAFDLSAPAWATGGRLQVGERSAPVAPRAVEAFVLARAGIYFLDESEVWFTDLRVIRPTGLTDVTGIALDAERRHLRVTVSPSAGTAPASAYAFDTRTGRRVGAEDASPRTVEQLRGEPVEVGVQGRSIDVTPEPDAVLTPARTGPGLFALLGPDDRPLEAFVARTGRRVPLRPALERFHLAAWTGPATFYGVSLIGKVPDAVVGCDLRRGRCRTLGVVPDGLPVVFEGGTAGTVAP